MPVRSSLSAYFIRMCNRFRSVNEWSDIPRRYHSGPRLNFEFNPNVAPTELVPAILARPERDPETVLARFGINKEGKDGKRRPPLLNARTDSLRRGSFARLLKTQRCVIPCQGFYEWRKDGPQPQPYYFSRADGQTMMLAGIWDEAEHKGDRRPAFAILTDEPNAFIAPYHDRMPVALAGDDMVAAWLDLNQAAPLDLPLLLDLDAFAVRPMDRRMNNVRQKELAAIDPRAA